MRYGPYFHISVKMRCYFDILKAKFENLVHQLYIFQPGPPNNYSTRPFHLHKSSNSSSLSLFLEQYDVKREGFRGNEIPQHVSFPIAAKSGAADGGLKSTINSPCFSHLGGAYYTHSDVLFHNVISMESLRSCLSFESILNIISCKTVNLLIN